MCCCECNRFANCESTKEVARFKCPWLNGGVNLTSVNTCAIRIHTSSSREEVPKRGATMSAKCKTLNGVQFTGIKHIIRSGVTYRSLGGCPCPPLDWRSTRESPEMTAEYSIIFRKLLTFINAIKAHTFDDLRTNK